MNIREHEMYDTIRDRELYVRTREAKDVHKSYFLLHREAWIDIGRSKMYRFQELKRAKESCFARLSPSVQLIILIMKEHQRKRSPFCVYSFLLLRTRGRK